MNASPFADVTACSRIERLRLCRTALHRRCYVGCPPGASHSGELTPDARLLHRSRASPHLWGDHTCGPPTP